MRRAEPPDGRTRRGAGEIYLQGMRPQAGDAVTAARYEFICCGLICRGSISRVYLKASQKLTWVVRSTPALRFETVIHQASSERRSQASLTLMPSANLIQSAKRWLGTAITTGMSAPTARSIK